jgi:hypothetical protein
MAINPLQPPINYAAQMVNLAPAFQGFGEAMAQRRERTQEQAKQEEAARAKAEYGVDLQAAIKNPSQEAWYNLAIKHPNMSPQVLALKGAVGQDRLDTEFNLGFQVSNALKNKNSRAALAVLTPFIEGKKNTGEPLGIFQKVADAINGNDLVTAEALVNGSLVTADPKRFKETVEALRAADGAAGFKIMTDAEKISQGLDPSLQLQQGPDGKISLIAAGTAAEPISRPVTEEERKTYKLPPNLPFQIDTKGKVTQIGGGGQTINVGTQDQRARDTLALKELDIPRAKEFSDAAASGRSLARDSRIIASLLKGKGGGQVVRVTADIARNFGFESETVTANDLANALATRGAVQIRAPGSGATSDLEFKSYLQAFPSLSNSERGRELMARYAEAFAKRSARLADHARKLIREDRYTEEEISRFDDSLGAVLDKAFYEFAGTGPRANVPDYPGRRPSAPPSPTPLIDSLVEKYGTSSTR